MKKFEALNYGDRMKKEDKFFSTPFLLSYSGINKLLYSPDAFYRHYILNQREDTQTDGMIEGSLLHCLLLTPERFDDEYIMASTKMPSDSQKKLIYNVFELYKMDMEEDTETARTKLGDYDTDILSYLSEINLYQSLKTDEGRLKKILTEDNNDYWSYLKEAEGKTIISVDTYDFIKEAVEKVKSNPQVMEIMGFFADSMNGISKINEVVLVQIKEELPFNLRGIIDNLVFDPSKKEIRINDLKRSQKSISTIAETIEFYKYWIQAAMYHNMVIDNYGLLPEYKDWKIVYRFIIVDTYGQTGIVKISDETMAKWKLELNNVIQEAKFHFDKKDFSLPYNFLINENHELVL